MPIQPNTPQPYTGGSSVGNAGGGMKNNGVVGQSGWTADNPYLSIANYTYKGNSSDALTQQSNDAAARTNPTADYSQANADAAQGALAANGQQNSLGYLANAASGQGPSAASAQFQQSLGQAQAAQQSAANSARGGGMNMAAAERGAAQTMGAQTIAGANQASQLRANEMINAQNAYAGASTAARNSATAAQGQDANQAMGQANLALQGRNQNDQTALAWSNQANDAAKSTLQGTEAYSGQSSTNQNTTNSLNMQDTMQNQGIDAANFQAGMGALAGGVSAISSAGMMSDRRAKMNVKAADGDVRKFLDSMQAMSFDYKGQPGQHHTGIMAQDVQGKSEAGSRMVADTPQGKVLKTGSPDTMATVLASMAELNKRLAAVESKKSAKRASK